jgi:hypothetical protein
MVRTLTSALMLAVLSLTGLSAISAQTGPSGPASDAQSSSLSDSELDALFRRMPGVHVSVERDGSRSYAFTVRRNNGVELPLLVNVTDRQVTVVAQVSNPVTLRVPLDEFNHQLERLNIGTEFRLRAVTTPSGKTLIFAGTQIGRLASVKEFAQRWNRFLQTAEQVRARLDR